MNVRRERIFRRQNYDTPLSERIAEAMKKHNLSKPTPVTEWEIATKDAENMYICQYFKDTYEDTLKFRKQTREQFLNVIKFSPFMFAISYFFYQKIEYKISFKGDDIVWFNVILVCQFLLLCWSVLLSAYHYFSPPLLRIPASPKTLSREYNDIISHHLKYDVQDLSAESVFLANRLNSYIDDAEFNDKNNLRIRASWTFCWKITIFSTLLVAPLILMIITR